MVGIQLIECVAMAAALQLDEQIIASIALRVIYGQIAALLDVR